MWKSCSSWLCNLRFRLARSVFCVCRKLTRANSAGPHANRPRTRRSTAKDCQGDLELLDSRFSPEWVNGFCVPYSYHCLGRSYPSFEGLRPYLNWESNSSLADCLCQNGPLHLTLASCRSPINQRLHGPTTFVKCH